MFSQRVFRFALLIALFALTLTAQTGSGTVQGSVKDASGASIPGATLTLVNTATSVEHTTKTNDVGLFVFPPAVPGNYQITAQAPGMETWKGTFLLPVGETVEISPVLKVGAVTTQVTVAGEVAPLVPTSDATISRDLEHARIEQLPIDGRSIANLVVLATPSLSGGQDGSINPIDTGLRDAVELYQDGAVKKNRDVGDWAGRLPGVDSIEEVQVQTSLSSAQFDRPGSVLLSTKAGTNGVHGSLFETNRSTFGVARRRQDVFTTAPHYVRNEFGGSVGGPVYIPKIYNGKNRTFFFTSWEWLRQFSKSTSSTAMATPAQRNGDYSGATDGLPLVDTQGRLTQLYDPLSTGASPTWTRTPFPNNVLPASRESSNAKYLYSITPQPYYANVNPFLGSNYFGELPTNGPLDHMMTNRIDERISDKDQVFGRFSVDRDTQTYGTGSVPALGTSSLNWVYNYYGDVSAVGSWTHSFSPTFLSQTQFSYSHEFKFTGSPTDPNIPNMADYLNEPNLGNDPLTAYQTSGMGPGFSFSNQQARQNTSNIYVLNEDFTKMYGKHQLQFGGRLHMEWLNSWIDQPTSTISYNANYTALFDPTTFGTSYSATPRTGYSGADFFMGYVYTFKDTTKRPAFNLRDNEVAGYIQDNWKATSRLTVNLGLRYEYMPPETTVGGFQVGFDQATDKMVLSRPLTDMYASGYVTPGVITQLQNIGVQFESYQDAKLPQGLIYGKKLNFEPRVGFAYRLGGNVKPLMLRGGWGLYDAQTALRTWDNLDGSAIPWGYPVQYYADNTALKGVVPAAGAPVNDGLPNFGVRSAPYFIAGTAGSRTVLDNPQLAQITPGCCAMQYLDPQQPPTLDQEWNFSIGREMFAGIVGTATYVGTHASNIPENYNFNSAPNDYIWYTTTGLEKATGTYASTAQNVYDKTTYGSITEFQKRSFSNASSATLEAQKRFSKGIGFQFAYILTNAMTESTLVGNGGGSSVAPIATYLPGTVPNNLDDLNRFLNYQRDTATPHQQLRWNFVVDLPFGRGKAMFGNAGKLVDEIIGGWQIAGTGTYNSRYWTLPASNYGPNGQVTVYGKFNDPIMDCQTARCQPGYLYDNGYITPPVVNRTNALGVCTGICGIPTGYAPNNLPLITYGQTTLPANAPSNTVLSTYWETNNVWIPLKDGNTVRTTINTNLPAWRNQYVAAPWVFGLNASAFKVFSLTESAKLRLNMDFFQVLNNPGIGTPGSNGIISLANSNNGARDLQLTLRLTW